MTNEVYAKIHQKDGRQVLAIADPSLIGATLTNDRLRFRVSEHFYAGTLLPLPDALALLRNFPNANLLGSVVLRAVDEGFVSEEAILWVHDPATGQQVPHAMIIHI